MSKETPRTSLFYYVPVLLLALGLVAYIFVSNFQSGEESARNAPPPVPKNPVAQVDLRALAKDASLATNGQTLFQINCASCHGPEGYGNGPRAEGLNPPPRNYHTQAFKFGTSIYDIYHTLENGSPGTSMPAFSLLPPEDVIAMAHFVRTMIPKPEPTTDAVIDKFPAVEGGGATAAVTSTATVPADTGKRIPILLAMERMALGVLTSEPGSATAAKLPGAALYAQNCASCHGVRGEGQRFRVLTVAPYRYHETVSLIASGAPWTQERNKFTEIVVKGLPGRSMPGNGTLTTQDVDQLYAFLKGLRGG